MVHGKNCKLGRWLDIYNKTPLQCKKLIEKESNNCDPTWFASRQGPNPSDLGDRNCFCAQKDSNCGQPSEQVDDPAVSIFKISPPPPKTGTQIRSCRSRDRSKQVDAKLSGVKWCVDVTDSWTHEQLNQCAQQQGNVYGDVFKWHADETCIYLCLSVRCHCKQYARVPYIVTTYVTLQVTRGMRIFARPKRKFPAMSN